MKILKLYLVVVGLFLLMSRQSECGCDFNPDNTAITLYPVPTFIEPKDECITNMGYIGSANYPIYNPPVDIMESCYLRSNDSNHVSITVTVTILNFNQFVREGRHYLTVSALSRTDCQSTNTSLHIEAPETHGYDPDNDVTYMETITADIIHVQYVQQQQQTVGNGGYYLLGFESELNILVTCNSCTGDDCLEFSYAVCTPLTTQSTPTTMYTTVDESTEQGLVATTSASEDPQQILLMAICLPLVLFMGIAIGVAICIIKRKVNFADGCSTNKKEEGDRKLKIQHANKTEVLEGEEYDYPTYNPETEEGYTSPALYLHNDNGYTDLTTVNANENDDYIYPVTNGLA